MTTNAGSEKSNAVSGFTSDRDEQNETRIERALLKFLRPEFLNRVDEVITFRHLSESDFEGIAKIMLNKLKDHLAEKSLKLKYSTNVLSLIAKQSYSEKYGARNMRRYIEKEVEDKIASIIIDSFPKKVEGISITVKNDTLVFNSI